ncbi:MAG: ROK family protein [Gammaproteobacteria bacterium]
MSGSGSVRIGVDLGGTKIEAMAMDAAGQSLARARVPTPAGDYHATVNAVAELVADLERELDLRGRVGIGTPGAVSAVSGCIKNANSTCLNDRPLKQDLEAALQRPVRLANDADCMALSEAVDGAGAGADSVFGVIIGTGTGGGIVVKGRLLAGPNRIAGEWGHNPLPWAGDDERPGPRCYCGKNGCIETFISGPGLAADHHAVSGERCSAREIAERAELGDASAAATLERYVDRLARSLAVVINILDPHVIVLGGGVSKISGLYAQVPQRWGRYVFSDRVATRLLPALHGDASGVRGAAWLWAAGE